MGLPDVKFFMSAVKVVVINSSAKPTIVKKTTMVNSSSNTVIVNTGITSQEEETRSTSWTDTQGIDITQTIDVSIEKWLQSKLERV